MEDPVVKKTGRLQVYTGNGKGKTTAALGLAVRAACSGMRVYIGQFMKGQDYSEMCLPDRFPEITMEQFGTPEFILPGEKPSSEDIQLAENGLSAVRAAMISGVYDMVIADEICVTAYMGLVSEEQVLELASVRPGNVEVVFTGRYAGDAVIKVADLVTEMIEIKHYFNTEKLSARTGIEN
ncbi:MAG: cob(I)yrinic acid a,c-diamide adenosyltransferase [Gemmatimonadaceae bacterium 4484_173]|nr:MAG: cob(I)yrinic acid a,c-diamide adenosyltransferase [Gemmatimonadaceae bacterium 4484_173]